MGICDQRQHVAVPQLLNASDGAGGLLPLAAAVLAAQLAYGYHHSKADVFTNRSNGKDAEEFLASSLSALCCGAGIETQVYMKTPEGLRIVDVVNRCDGTLHEVKVGQLSKSVKTIKQLLKDLALSKEYGLKPHIHFFKSPETGKVGPTKPLQKWMSENNIAVHVHNHTVKESSGACGHCTKSLPKIADAAMSKATGAASPETATTKVTESMLASAQVSQALCAAGALNLAVALAALAAARRSAHLVSQIELEKLPELHQETEEFRVALQALETSLRTEIDSHFADRKMWQMPFPFSLFFSLITSCHQYIKEKRFQAKMGTLRDRYVKLKDKMEKTVRETKDQQAASIDAGAFGAATAAVGVCITIGSLGADCGMGAIAGLAGVGAGAVTVGTSLAALERCGRILNTLQDLLGVLQREYGSVEKTYFALMKVYELLEEEFGISNQVRLVCNSGQCLPA